MKKTFYHALRAMCVGAMTLFAVSCYDDSELNGKLDNLSAEVQEIQAKLAELEADLNEQVTALTALTTQVEELDATVAAIKVETSEEGLTTVTLADGTKVVVSANGVVTIVNDGGKDYWAVVDQNGVVKNLNVLVGHELNFSVDPATFELMVNGNGTGAYVSVESAYVLGEVVETEDSVTLTIGDKTYTLAKKSATEFEIVSGKVYFTEDETKNLPLVVEGMKSSMIASCPKAWTAEVKDGQLSITAPSESVVDFDYNGTVEVWVLTVDGTVLNGKVKVALTSDPAVVTYDAVNAVVTLEFDFTSDGFGADGIFYGACAASDFDAQAIAEAIEAKLNGTESQAHVFSSMDADGNNVKSANHKLDELLGSAPTPGVQYIIWTFGNDAEWVDHDGSYMPPSIAKVEAANEDFSKTYIDYYKVTVVAAEPTFQGVDVKITAEGVEKFFAGYYDPAANYETPFEGVFYPGCAQDWSMYMGTNLYEVLTEGLSSGWGPKKQTLVFGAVYEGSYEGAMWDLYNDSHANFAPGATPTLVILPLIEGKSLDSYTEADLITYNYELAEISLQGGTAAVTLGTPANVGLDYFEIPFSTEGAQVYYGIYSAELFSEVFGEVTGTEFIELALQTMNGFPLANVATGKSGVIAPSIPEYEDYYTGTIADESFKITANTEYVVFAFAVDADGNCGEVTKTTVKTNDYVISDAVAITSLTASVTPGETEGADGLATLRAAVTGNPVKLYYRIDLCDVSATDHAYKPSVSEGIMADVKESIASALGGDWHWKIIPISADNYTDGKITFEEYLGNGRTRIVHAFVQDASGVFSTIAVSETFFDASQRAE
jgi:outer membrane murein-binding lipoprotein Lpp